MTVVIVDYAGLGGPEKGSRKVPGRLSGKFVQIRNGDKEYLVFSTADRAPYHADIVRLLCREKGLDGVYDEGRKRFDISEPGWIIAGGGKFEIDGVQRYVRFYDNSMAYGRFDSGQLKEKLHSADMLKGFEIRIE